jgi:hypothetical protein
MADRSVTVQTDLRNLHHHRTWNHLVQHETNSEFNPYHEFYSLLVDRFQLV